MKRMTRILARYPLTVFYVLTALTLVLLLGVGWHP